MNSMPAGSSACLKAPASSRSSRALQCNKKADYEDNRTPALEALAVLRHMQCFPDRFHVWNLYCSHAHARYLAATSVGSCLLHARDQLCTEFAHDFLFPVLGHLRGLAAGWFRGNCWFWRGAQFRTLPSSGPWRAGRRTIGELDRGRHQAALQFVP